MKKYILLRTLRSLLSIFVVTALTYTIIYTMVPRRLIFRQDPNYNKIAKTADSKANYENTIYERMGYIDYYDTKELQEKASSLDKSVTTKPTKENKAIYQKYVDSLGHGWRLHQSSKVNNSMQHVMCQCLNVCLASIRTSLNLTILDGLKIKQIQT